MCHILLADERLGKYINAQTLTETCTHISVHACVCVGKHLCVCICACVWLSIYIYIYIYKWPTVVEGDLKAPFSIAIISRCIAGRYSFPLIAPLTLEPLLKIPSIKQEGIKHHFLSLWFDSAWDRTPVLRTICVLYDHYANWPVVNHYRWKWQPEFKS